MKIVALVGSLGKNSLNLRLFKAIARQAPSDIIIEALDISALPLINLDLIEDKGMPKPVEKLKASIASADALLVVTPEHNGSLPAPLKNALDWASRPQCDIPRIYGGKLTAICGATPGASGTKNAQNALIPVLDALGCAVWQPGRPLQISHAKNAINAEGIIDDPEIAATVADFANDFYSTVTRFQQAN